MSQQATNQEVDQLKIQTNTALVKLLSDGDEADRCYASRTLGVIGDTSVVPALIKSLRDEDIDVCVDSADALGLILSDQLDENDAIDALVDSLKNDPDGEVRTSIATALGKIGSKKVVTPLIEIASDRPENLDFDSSSDDGWDRWWDIQLEAVKALGKMQSTVATPLLIEIITDEKHQDIESEALQAIADIGSEDGIEFLTEQLQNSSSSRVKRRIAIAMGKSRNDYSKALGRAMQDNSADVRGAAVTGLAMQNATRYQTAISLLIKDPDAEVRESAIKAILKISSDDNQGELLEQLTNLLDDESAEVKYSALQALYSRTDSLSDELFDNLLSLISNPDIEVAVTACKLLDKANNDQKEKTITALQELFNRPEVNQRIRREAILTVGSIATPTNKLIDNLANTLKDEQKPVRLSALNCLMQLENQKSDEIELANTPLEIIITALVGSEEDKEPKEEEENSETAENNSEEDKEIPGLAEHPEPESTTDSNFSKPANTNSTLASIAIDNVEASLRVHDDTPDEKLAEELKSDDEAQEFLGLIEEDGDDTERLYTRYHTDLETDVRRLAAHVLAKHESEESINALIAALQDKDSEVRRVATESLATIAHNTKNLSSLMNSYGVLVSQLELNNSDLCITTLDTLGEFAHRGAIPVIRNQLNNKDNIIRIHAIKALEKLLLTTNEQDNENEEHIVLEKVSNAEIISQLIKLLEDEDSGVRITTANALAALANLSNTSTSEILDKLITAGFAFGGAQARIMAQSLKEIDKAQAAKEILAIFDKLNSSFERRFGIEMLEEIFV